MLISFSVENFRSIKEKQTLSLLSAKKFSSEEHLENITSPTDTPYNLSFLKSAVLFGGNASGKSNLLNAIDSLVFLVKNSTSFKLDEGVKKYDPFKLCNKSNKNPCSFSIDFLAKNNLRYLYEISFDKKRILKEQLQFLPDSPKARWANLFKRELGKKTVFGSHYIGNQKFEIYENQLILSQVGIRPIQSLMEPYRFFSTHIFCSTIHDTRYDDAIIRSFSNLLVEDSSNLKSNLNKLIRAADTEIVEIQTREYNEGSFGFPEDMPSKIKKDIIEKYKHRIKTVHNLYEGDELKGQEVFDISEESTGTIKLIVVGGMILDALQDGTTIIIDELDKSLHPLLTQMLIQLFNSKENNPNNAQLIFASHDISLINREIFRLDQLYFSEKDYQGISNYYRLSDFKNISKVAPIAKWYLMGRFGATPMINEFELTLDLAS